VNPGLASSYPTWFAVVGTTLFFNAYDDIHGRELWAYSLAEPARRRAVKTAAVGTGAAKPHAITPDSRSTVSTRLTAHRVPGTAPAR
jgi:ELWxxDGT repeat protein